MIRIVMRLLWGRALTSTFIGTFNWEIVHVRLRFVGQMPKVRANYLIT
jgi:hypothetical protein